MWFGGKGSRFFYERVVRWMVVIMFGDLPFIKSFTHTHTQTGNIFLLKLIYNVFFFYFSRELKVLKIKKIIDILNDLEKYLM